MGRLIAALFVRGERMDEYKYNNGYKDVPGDKLAFDCDKEDLSEERLFTINYKKLSTNFKVAKKKKEDDILPSNSETEFPEGLSDDYFSILYYTNFRYQPNAAVLNSAARNYMHNLYSDDENYSLENLADSIFYNSDSGGVYVLRPVGENDNYTNEIVNKEGTTQRYYKVYIKGTCRVLDIDENSLENLGGSSDITMANGYFATIANGLYLFVNNNLGMVYLNDDYSKFKFAEEDDWITVHDNNSLEDKSYYIKIFKSGNAITNLSTTTVEENNQKMIASGTFRKIVLSDTITSIDHFWGSPNPTTIIFSTKLEEIGEDAFSNSQLSATTGYQTVGVFSNLKKIGDRAFANCPNIRLFEVERDGIATTTFPSGLTEIGEEAFYNNAAINALDLTKCNLLNTVGLKAFAGCNNLRTVYYLGTQVEPDGYDYTQKLYLPVDTNGSQYAPRLANKSQTLTATYNYGLDDNGTYYSNDSYNAITTAIDEDMTLTVEEQLIVQNLIENEYNDLELKNGARGLTFLNCTNIKWVCE